MRISRKKFRAFLEIFVSRPNQGHHHSIFTDTQGRLPVISSLLGSVLNIKSDYFECCFSLLQEVNSRFQIKQFETRTSVYVYGRQTNASCISGTSGDVPFDIVFNTEQHFLLARNGLRGG